MKINTDYIKRIFKSRLFLIIISLLISITLWAYVSTVQNPISSLMYENIEVNMDLTGSVPESEELVLTKSEKVTINVELEATRQDLYKLKSDKNNIKATPDFTGVTKAGEYIIPINLEFPINGDIKIKGVAPTIKVTFDKKFKKQIPVKVTTKGEVSSGFLVDTEGIITNPLVIEVTGPQSIVETIAKAKVEADVGGKMETVSFRGKYAFFTTDEKEIKNNNVLVVDKDKVDVKIPIIKYKEVPLSVSIMNSSGGNDKLFIMPDVIPKTLKVSGSESALSSLNQIELDPIDIANIEKPTTIELDIKMPNDIKNVDEISKALVFIPFDNLSSKNITFNSFELVNVVAGQSIKVTNKDIQIKVRGIASDIEKVNSANTKVLVNIENQGLAKGTHKVKASIKFQEGLRVSAVGTYYVFVSVT